MNPEDPAELRRKLITWWSTIVGICLVIIVGSVFVTRSYLLRRDYEVENWRPPHITRLETDLQAVNRDGREVSLGELKGRVYVAGYQYTDCPAGCLGTAAVMKSLLEEFGDDPRFHLVSVSVDPEEDTPEKMDAWVTGHGIESDRWWFLTGESDVIRRYMRSEFLYHETEEITDPAVVAVQGPWAHDLRLAIVDGDANVRGYYEVMSADRGDTEYERLRRDLKMVLDPSLRLSDFE